MKKNTKEKDISQSPGFFKPRAVVSGDAYLAYEEEIVAGRREKINASLEYRNRLQARNQTTRIIGAISGIALSLFLDVSLPPGMALVVISLLISALLTFFYNEIENLVSDKRFIRENRSRMMSTFMNDFAEYFDDEFFNETKAEVEEIEPPSFMANMLTTIYNPS